MIFFKCHCTLKLHISFLLCCYFVILLSKIKNNSLHILVEFFQAISLMCMLAKNVFQDSTKAFCFGSSFLIFRLLAILFFVFMLIRLGMHLGFVNIVFKKILLEMVGEMYYGEFFIHVSIGNILQKLKRLMTSLQFIIRALNSTYKVCKVSIAIQSTPNFCIQKSTPMVMYG